MLKRLVRLVVLAAIVAAVVAAVRAMRRTEDPLPSVPVTPSDTPWPPLRAEPEPAAWVEPDAEGNCPDGYPIKAKMSSSIFHSPGQMNYDRTTPDRCYTSAEAAEADGLRAAKR